VIETIHGVAVHDPYRWLEDGNDREVQDWVVKQNELTRSALDAIPSRDRWHERLLALMGLRVVQAAQIRGDRLIVLERDDNMQQARLVARCLSDLGREPMVLVDPSSGSDDDSVAVDWFYASGDGELVAFGVSEGGTENSTLFVVRSADGSMLGEEIPNCRAASVAWEPDGSGFFYTRYPEGDEYNRTVHHHTLGEDCRSDPVIWAEHPTPQCWPNIKLSPSGRLLLIDAMVGWSRNDQHLLDRETREWRTIIAGVDAKTDFDFADDATLLGVTTLDAARGRIVAIDLAAPGIGEGSWRDVVPERDVIVSGLAVTATGFVAVTTTAGVDSIESWSQAGPQRDWVLAPIDAPQISTVVQLVTERDSDRVHAVVTGFDAPAALWQISEESSAELMHPASARSDIPDLTVSQVVYESIDGTSVGMFLIHAAGATLSAETPTILNGYGGFAITETPMWSPTIAAWCEAGGLYAIAGLRGGFEHGEAWHQAGRRENKQNVFDDFHAAADWLVDTGRTSRHRLAIAGGSNGGLLVGAALTQRPDLCQAVWCAVPLLDMIRFPRFLIAKLWTDEYGDPDVAEEFQWLLSYSPYHAVNDGGRYPAVLFTTAEGDTRVDPLHARKMTALLQHAAIGQDERPILLHQEGRAGHGVGKPVGKRAAEQADVLAFFSQQLRTEFRA
jgi:prolyl oligopeptidase